jgi:RNA polymerase sigma-70 factor (ECF subfamily)
MGEQGRGRILRAIAVWGEEFVVTIFSWLGIEMPSLFQAAQKPDQSAPSGLGVSTRPLGRASDPILQPRDLELYSEDLLRRAMTLTCGDSSRAKDLVQDTFERALGNLDRVVPGSNVRAWLYTIMVRRFRDILRHEIVRRAKTLDEERDAAGVEIERPPAWAAFTSADVRSALAEVSPDLRTTFEMREFERLPYRRIAEMTGVPTTTVGTRLMRARLQLRAILSRGLQPEEQGEEA